MAKLGKTCGYPRCVRERLLGWSNCARHYSAGHSTKQGVHPTKKGK